MSLRKLLLTSTAFALFAATQVGTAASSSGCPPPQSFSGACIQVIVWAKSPDGQLCCQYPNPCSTPAGWTTYYGPDCTNFVIEGL